MKALGSLLILGAVGVLATPGPLPVKIDAAKVRAPINPFIYGQFIEHLGRCIYGGIWAELLEDRKFFYPVSADYRPYRALEDSPFPVVGASPWEILGDAKQVTMIREGAFVGEHSVRLEPERGFVGLRQRDLEIVKGKEYSGYVWMRLAGDRPARLRVKLEANEAALASEAVLSVPTREWLKYPFRFEAKEGSPKAGLVLEVMGAGVDLGCVSLMPTDNVQGMRPDTLALLKQLNSPIYRWPGGNFVSGYDWRDGIGDRDRRPPRGNPAWTGVEHNDFGTDEFMAFCREIGTTPMVAVNTGFGDDYSAAQWVEYLNAGAETSGGALRVRNGHREPYGVKYYCVGNEMFGPWQLGFMQLSHYTQKHNRFVRAMRKVDPTIVLSGVGDIDMINAKNDPEQAKRGIGWSQGMLEACAEHMDLLSEHFYDGRLPWEKDKNPPYAEHVKLMKKAIASKAEKHRKLQASLPQLKGRVVPIAMDEWNYWHRDSVYGELGCVYDLADGLGIAMGLHEFFRHSDLIHMAHYAQTVNVIGAIKTNRTAAEFESTGLALLMYRRHFGSLPLATEGDFGALDIVAALTEDRRTLTLACVNPETRPAVLLLELQGLKPEDRGRSWVLTGATPQALNKPGLPREVDIREQEISLESGELKVPALSAGIYRFALR